MNRTVDSPNARLASPLRRLVAAACIVIATSCATTVPRFVKTHGREHPRVSIDVLRLQLAEKPGQKKLEAQLTALQT